MNVLYNFVEETRLRYKEVSRPNVVVHMADTVRIVCLNYASIYLKQLQPTYGPSFVWSNVKHKARRPLSSIILNEGVIDSLVKDAREFIDTEDWYVEAGIPHRRGYLLYGPPGTGKSEFVVVHKGLCFLSSWLAASTIYALVWTNQFSLRAFADFVVSRLANSVLKFTLCLFPLDCMPSFLCLLFPYHSYLSKRRRLFSDQGGLLYPETLDPPYRRHWLCFLFAGWLWRRRRPEFNKPAWLSSSLWCSHWTQVRRHIVWVAKRHRRHWQRRREVVLCHGVFLSFYVEIDFQFYCTIDELHRSSRSRPPSPRTYRYKDPVQVGD